MNILTLSEPINAQVSALQSSIDHRDDIIATAIVIKSVATQDELEIAVAALKELNAIDKETEAARKTMKAPILALGKQIDTIAEKFITPVEKEKTRIGAMVDAYQFKQRMEQQERERKARSEQEKAEREAREAQRKIEEQEREIERQRLLAEQAKTAKQREAAAKAQEEAQAKLLDSQLAAEEAQLTQQAAQMELAAPTNNPKGLTTRSLFDFEVTDPNRFIEAHREWFHWKKKEEEFKLLRAELKAALNQDCGHKWIPEDTQPSVTHSFGLRVFRLVKTSVR